MGVGGRRKFPLISVFCWLLSLFVVHECAEEARVVALLCLRGFSDRSFFFFGLASEGEKYGLADRIENDWEMAEKIGSACQMTRPVGLSCTYPSLTHSRLFKQRNVPFRGLKSTKSVVVCGTCRACQLSTLLVVRNEYEQEHEVRSWPGISILFAYQSLQHSSESGDKAQVHW